MPSASFDVFLVCVVYLRTPSRVAFLRGRLFPQFKALQDVGLGFPARRQQLLFFAAWRRHFVVLFSTLPVAAADAFLPFGVLRSLTSLLHILSI